MHKFGLLAALAAPIALCVGCGGNQAASSGGTPVTPAGPDFTLSTQPSQLSLIAGSSATFTVNITWSGTPAGPVSIAAALPAGISAVSSLPASIPVGTTSATVTLSAAASTVAGSSIVSLTATASGSATLIHTYSLTVNVSVPPPPPVRTLTRKGYILTGGQPEGVVHDPAHKLLWVSVPNLGQVLVIDPAQRKVLNRIQVPFAGAMDLSPDGTKIVVGSDTLPHLTFIDVASQSITHVAVFTTAAVSAAFPGFGTAIDYDGVASPRFVAGGDVVFLAFNTVFRWSSSTDTCVLVPNANLNPATTLSRTPDGSKVLITTGENELEVYDPATNSISAKNQNSSPFAAADPVHPRFALFDSNGYDIVDTNLQTLGAVAPNLPSGNAPYAFQFSADGSQLFVALSGLFGGSYAFQTVDTVNYKVGGQAPLTNLNGGIAETPLAVDSTNLIYGIDIGGVVLDDPLNYFPGSTPPHNGAQSNALTPNTGPVATSTSSTIRNLYSSPLQSVYFDGVPGSISGATSSIGTDITLTSPPIQTPGPVTVHLFSSDGSFSVQPAAFTYGVQAVALEPSAGPASGGITADLLAYGVDNVPSAISVTVGGVAAKVNSTQIVGGDLPYLLPLYDINFVPPPGTAGISADVAVTASNYTATMPHAFTYEPAITNNPFPSSAIPGSIFFDRFRQQAYLLSPTRIDVFSLKSNSFLAPIIPPTKNGTLGLTGLDLSLDGKTMVIADMTDQTLAVVNPDDPSSATLVPFAPMLDGNTPFGPRSVVANSKGTWFISPGDSSITGSGGNIWEYDPVSGTITQSTKPLSIDLQFSGCRLVRSADGTTVVVQSPDSNPATSAVWTAASGTFTAKNLPGFTYDAAVSSDGSLIGSLVDPDPGSGPLYEFALDPAQDLLASMSDPDWLHAGWLWGSFFDPSDTLFYVPNNEGLDIYDTHSGHLQRRIGVKEAPNQTVYTAATSDTTGEYLLLLTNDGLDVIQDVPPLAIASVSPLPNTASSGTVITVKGTNFVAGATVTISGQQASTIVTDSHTLTFSLPSVVASNTLVLANPDGSTFTY